jgi:Flp pilus assembly protein TadD
MKRLRIKTRTQGLVLRGVLLITAFIPILLTSFLSMSGEKRQPGNSSIIDLEGLITRVTQLNQQKKHQKAIDLLLEVVNKQKEDSLLKTLLVHTFDLFLEDVVRQGQKDFQKNRQDNAAYNQVAGALELLGDNFRAMEILLAGIQHNNKSVDLWMKIARLELKAHRDMEAFDVFREIIKLNTKNSEAYNNAAYILARSENSNARDLHEAEKLATNARKLDPKNAEYIDTLAEVHFKQGNLRMAQTLMEEAIKLAPNNDGFKEQLKRFKKGLASPIVGKSW